MHLVPTIAEAKRPLYDQIVWTVAGRSVLFAGANGAGRMKLIRCRASCGFGYGTQVADGSGQLATDRFECSDNWQVVPVWRQPWPCEIDCRYLMQLGTGASDRALDNSSRHSSMQRRHIFLADDQIDLEPLRSSLISR